MPQFTIVKDEKGLAFKWASREIISNFKNGGIWGGVRGFGIFLTAIFLGVFAIALVGTFSASLNSGLNDSGQILLGGDVDVRLTNQFADDDMLAYFAKQGQLTEVSHFRGMARGQNDPDNAILVDAKSVDSLYPLIGTLDVDTADARLILNPAETADILAFKADYFGVLVDQALLYRLDIEIGDILKFGSQLFDIRGTIHSEPDRVSAPFTFGPRIIISREAMLAADLIETGSIFDQYHKIQLFDKTETAVENFKTNLKQDFPKSVNRVMDKTNAAPNLQRIVERLTIFLTLISLTILVVGGVGIANSVKLYIEGKRASIATFKSLGATDGLVFKLYSLQIFGITLFGIIMGIIFGAGMPYIFIMLFKDLLPLPLVASVYFMPLLAAGLSGLLISAIFSLLPLAAIYRISPRSLYRAHIENSRFRPSLKFVIPILAFLALLVWLTLALADYHPIAQWFVGAVFTAFILLRVVGFAINFIMRKMPRTKRPELRLAISNMARPQSPLTTIIISLGLGLTLLVTLSMVEGNIARQLKQDLPERAPAFFLLDIKKDQVKPLNTLLASTGVVQTVETVPLMRGKIVKLKDIDVNKLTVPEGQGWVTRGSRGLTYSATLPDNSSLTQGEWWDEDYSGEPLVSLVDDIADAFELNIGDYITINLFGREIRAKIASFRHVEWQGLGINFVMVFSPNTLEDAPHVFMATITLDETASIEDEANIQKQLVNKFPTITTIAMRSALETAYELTTQLTMVIRLAGGLTLITGFLVLGGAIAAGNRARTYDLVILKALGATRNRLLGVLVAEFTILGLLASLIALLLGSIAAQTIMGFMSIPYEFIMSRAVLTLILGTLSVLVLGLFGTWRILGRKAGPFLQNT
ncbi:MAG: FtsX-like permease family protein [Rhizobiales bacterium]|nr:FtsX-like permease family protein [Hyphomicrobiales bacterium]NRB14598.1 FtsX-like permease family protein [Hyphomicrobiales bacterium]